MVDTTVAAVERIMHLLTGSRVYRCDPARAAACDIQAGHPLYRDDDTFWIRFVLDPRCSIAADHARSAVAKIQPAPPAGATTAMLGEGPARPPPPHPIWLEDMWGIPQHSGAKLCGGIPPQSGPEVWGNSPAVVWGNSPTVRWGIPPRDSVSFPSDRTGFCNYDLPRSGGLSPLRAQTCLIRDKATGVIRNTGP
jgi:hypothetical protein